MQNAYIIPSKVEHCDEHDFIDELARALIGIARDVEEGEIADSSLDCVQSRDEATNTGLSSQSHNTEVTCVGPPEK